MPRSVSLSMKGVRHMLEGALLSMVSMGVVPGCAAGLAVGRGGPVYELRVDTINGVPTANQGPAAHPACLLQVGNQVGRVWLANPSNLDHESPVVLKADAEALKEGILVERSWNQAVVHYATDAELAAGAAVVYVPGPVHPTTVELRFELVSHLDRSDQKNDLAKRGPGLQQPVSSGDLH